MSGPTAGVPEEFLKLVRAAWPEATLSGKHPDVKVATQELPTFCLQCHTKDGKMPLNQGLHLVHFYGGGENHFITGYGGFCTQCHQLNLDLEKPPAGTMIIKTGREGE